MKSVQIGLTTMAIAALVLSTGGVAAAGGLPDGEYDCGGGYTFVAMGKIDIKGDRFRYRPFGKVVRDFAPYSMDANGVITWGGKFGGLDDPPARIVKSTRERWGFNVNFQGNPNALVNTMSCSLTKK